jgi:uncharacterized integral membrane protein
MRRIVHGTSLGHTPGSKPIRTVLAQLGPGVLLPGLIYYVVSRRTGVLVALAVASSVPLLDTVIRLVRGKRPTIAGFVFIGFAGLSVGLAMLLRSPMFILAKGAALSALVGLAFAVSAAIRRPLTRTLALRLTTEHPEDRRRLAERWRHPKALAVFRTLSMGWGILLLVTAAQQAILALTLSPGVVMALDPPVHAFVTVAGIGVSILYVRRSQRANPELGLLADRVR